MFTVAIGHWTVYVWSLAGVHAYRYGDCCVHTLSKPSWVINGRKQKENSWLHVEQIWQLSLASCIVYLHLHQFLHGRFWKHTFLHATVIPWLNTFGKPMNTQQAGAIIGRFSMYHSLELCYRSLEYIIITSCTVVLTS